MRTFVICKMAAVVLAVLAVAAAARAEEARDPVTVAGDVVCAKCTLEVPGVEQCQNVVVSGEGAERKELWLVDNDVNQAFGEVCKAKRPVSVTGTIHEKDGKKWLTASKIEAR